MNRGVGLLITLAYLFAMFSCKSTKEVMTKRRGFNKTDEVILAIQESDLNYEALILKASISVVTEKRKISFKSQIRIKKDSAIWGAVTFFGIAGAKTLITVDSLKVVNYKDRNYMVENNTKLSEIFKTKLISLENLQALLTGDKFNLGSIQKFHVKLLNGQYEVSNVSERKSNKDWVEKKHQKLERKIEKNEEKNREKGIERWDRKQERKPNKFSGIEAKFWVDTTNAKVTSMEIKDYLFNGILKVKYADFEDTEAGLFPMRCDITIEAEEKIQLNIVYSKVSVAKTVKMPFSIPKRYKKVEM